MKCDYCGRERTDEQFSRHDSSGIRLCSDREECREYRTDGRFMEVAEEIVGLIIGGGLCSAECAHDKEHGCVIVWSSGTQEQIGAHIRKRLGQ